MTTRRSTAAQADPIAKRCLEILDQMAAQLVASKKFRSADDERLLRLRQDLAKLVHGALYDRGNPDIIARIRDCYRHCEVDIDDAAILRLVRGTVKGELRKAGIDPTLPGIDPALDPPTIILTTRRTIQRMARQGATLTEPGPALDRKTPAAKPPTTRSSRRKEVPAVREFTVSEMRAAFDHVVASAQAAIRSSGHAIMAADHLAAIYNDPGRKARFLQQVADLLPQVDAKPLALAVDGFFRDGFKGSYIERADRQGNRRACKR